MDPSAAPWRAFDAGEPSTSPVAAIPPTQAPPSMSSMLPMSPVTLAAVLGVVILAIAAFVLAASDQGGGTLRVAGGASLAPIDGPGGAATSGSAAANGPAELVVQVVGAVREPGVYRLPAGARVGDLVDAAGGFGPRLDAARAALDLNLAARLADGDRVVVPSRGDTASSTTGTSGEVVGGSGSGSDANGLIDLNRATTAELEALPGIGPVTAEQIITSREEQRFTSVDDLRTRKLVGAKTFDGLKDLVSVR